MSIEHGSPEIVTGNSGSDINFQEQLQRIHAYKQKSILKRKELIIKRSIDSCSN